MEKKKKKRLRKGRAGCKDSDGFQPNPACSLPHSCRGLSLSCTEEDDSQSPCYDQLSTTDIWKYLLCSSDSQSSLWKAGSRNSNMLVLQYHNYTTSYPGARGPCSLDLFDPDKYECKRACSNNLIAVYLSYVWIYGKLLRAQPPHSRPSRHAFHLVVEWSKNIGASHGFMAIFVSDIRRERVYG